MYDLRHNEIQKLMLEKSLDSNGTGALLQPQFMSETVGEIRQTVPSLYNILPKFDAPGGVYAWNNWDAEVTNGGPQGYTVVDSATLGFANTDPVIIRYMIDCSIIVAPFQISEYEIASTAKLIDLVSLRISSGLASFHRRQNIIYLSGDSVNSTNPGLLASLSGSANVSAGTIAAGTTPTLSYGLFNQIESAQEALGYSVDAWLVSTNVATILRGAAFNRNRFINMETMAIGYSQNTTDQVLLLNGKPVIRDFFLYGAAGNTDAIVGLSLDPEAIGVAELRAPMVKEVGQLPTQPLTRNFVISAFEALAVKEPYKHSYVKGVVTSGVTSASFD